MRKNIYLSSEHLELLESAKRLHPHIPDSTLYVLALKALIGFPPEGIPSATNDVQTFLKKIEVSPATPVRKEYKGSNPPFNNCPKHKVFYNSCGC